MLNFSEKKASDNINDIRSERDKMTSILLPLMKQCKILEELEESGDDHQELGEKIDAMVDQVRKLNRRIGWNLRFLKMKTCRYSVSRFKKYLLQKSEEFERKGNKAKGEHDYRWGPHWFINKIIKPKK